MGIKLLPTQQYYVIAKHSGKALSSPNANDGTALKQVTFDANSDRQKFRFDKGQHFFWILMPPFKERYVKVNSASKDDGAAILQGTWQPHQHNLLFRFVPAGDGYYRIMALHSNKFFDVYGADKGENAAVVQHRFMPSDNQLFKIVPIPKKLGANTTTYVEANNITRDAIMGLTGLVPEVGGGLKFIVGLFWSGPDKLGDMWEQMKSYVDVRARELIMEKKLEDMEDDIMGIMDSIEVINAYTNMQRKATELPALVNNIHLKQRRFLNKPLEILPYTIAMGTIIITLRHTMYTQLEKMSGTPVSAADKADTKTALKAAIKAFTDSVEKSRKEMIDWRMGKVKPASTVSASLGGSGIDIIPTTRTITTSTAKDEYDNWTMSYYYIVSETIFSKDTEGYHDHKVRAEFAAAQRKKQIEVQYPLEVEEMLRPAKFWKHMDPDAAPYVPVKKRVIMGAYGVVYMHNKFTGTVNSGITKIRFHAWAGGSICGMEVFYGNQSTATLQGRTGNQKSEITLASGEYINSVFGFAKDMIESIWMTTSLGQIVGGGTMNNKSNDNMFCADLPDSFTPKLARIDGSHNRDYLEQLSFEWEYED